MGEKNSESRKKCEPTRSKREFKRGLKKRSTSKKTKKCKPVHDECPPSDFESYDGAEYCIYNDEEEAEPKFEKEKENETKPTKVVEYNDIYSKIYILG